MEHKDTIHLSDCTNRSDNYTVTIQEINVIFSIFSNFIFFARCQQFQFVKGRLTNRFVSRERPSDVWREGVLPCDVSPTPKKYRFLPLFVSKIYHTLPLYCATVLFFLATSVRNSTESCFG